MNDNLETLRIWILGAGKFGCRAVQALSSEIPGVQIDLVDHNLSSLVPFQHTGIRDHNTDVIDYMHRHLEKHRKPDWIVPAVPLHVAFEWMRSSLSADYVVEKVAIPGLLFNDLSCNAAPDTGKIYISLADFLCPDDCCEPARFCTYTGEPRPYDLFQKLAGIRLKNFISVVVRSRQLAPGVGGYRPGDLIEALEDVRKSGSPILLSTACRCHGVLDAFTVIAKR